MATERGVAVVASLEDILERFDDVGVDMPIGLPPTWERHADREARTFLGHRGACVFPTPPRPIAHHTVHAEADADSRNRYGRGLSLQSFHLLAKIREVDAIVSPSNQERIIEVHPECAFARLAGKPLPPKRSPAGVAARREALATVFEGLVPSVRGAASDDVLDAYAVLWTVRRHLVGQHTTFGGDQTDERGLIMRIVI